MNPGLRKKPSKNRRGTTWPSLLNLCTNSYQAIMKPTLESLHSKTGTTTVITAKRYHPLIFHSATKTRIMQLPKMYEEPPRNGAEMIAIINLCGAAARTALTGQTMQH